MRLAFFKIHSAWSFHVVVLQRTATKCTSIQNALKQPLFCSVNLLFGVACGNLVKLPNVNERAGTLSVIWHSPAFNSDRLSKSENDHGKITAIF